MTIIDENQPLDQATHTHVTFNVSKSWKGIDTKIVTIHTGDETPCGSYRFERDREYPVYGMKDLSSMNVNNLCGGTMSESSPFIMRDLGHLEENHVSLELNAEAALQASAFPCHGNSWQP